MGYTHYWCIETEIDPATWRRIGVDARKLMAAFEGKLCMGYYHRAKPAVADAQQIRFNAVEGGYEDFFMTPERTRFSFCKTERQVYDAVVVAVLAVAAAAAPGEIQIQSDGTPEDWQPALAWAAQVLNRPVPRPAFVDFA